MEIKLNLDHVQYKHKPAPADVPALRGRLAKATTTTTPEDLLAAIEHGQSFTPAAMNGTTSETWQSQQVIVADIDNDGEKQLTPDDALMITNLSGFKPYAMYYSFSSTEEHLKYRIMVILDQPITDATEARNITARLAAAFNEYCPASADTAIKDNARLIYGSKPGSVFFNSGSITPLAILRTLPPISSHTASDGASVADIAQAAADATRSAQRASDGQFDLIPLLEYIEPDDYDVWIKTGMALKAEGYDVFVWESWSRRSEKYKPFECEAKWKSFSNEKGGGVSGAYITDMAKRSGYIPPKDRIKEAPAPAAVTASPETIPEPTDDDAPPARYEKAPAEPETPTPEPTPQACLDEFFNEIQSERFKPIPTGIEQLDAALQGGLERRTLVTLAAAPGTGKTAIAQYILENMARKGHPVVFVNLEMDRSQLYSRSFARISHHMKIIKQWSDDITALDVKRGYAWTKTQREVVNNCKRLYESTINPNFYYVTTNPENTGSIENTLSDILTKLHKITAELEAQGKPAPLVCIDYLQFIDFDMYEDGQRKPDNADAIKQTLKYFKQFAMSHDTCVLVITANNRASNADGRASMDSGRDTSNIEYSGDVMMSLVYTAIEEKWTYATGKQDKDGNDKRALIDNDFIMDKIDFTLQKKEEYPLIAKLLTLKVVKGRSIQSRGAAKFIYDGRYFYFEADTGIMNPYA